MPYLKLNGFDILPYVKEGGIVWTENDLDGPNSGRALTGDMHRDKIAEKRKVQLTCTPQKVATTNRILNAISPASFRLETDIDPRYGISSFSVYCSTRPATCLLIDKGTGEATWDGINFSVIEL